LTNMIEVWDVTRTYGSGPAAVQALRRITFTVGEGSWSRCAAGPDPGRRPC